MNTKAVWNDCRAFLAACGSPGNALAYRLNQGAVGSRMLHCATGPNVLARVTCSGTDSPPDAAPAAAQGATVPAGSPTSWIGRLFSRLEEWSWRAELREREAYLAQAQNESDLEARMRRLDDVVLSRERALG
jgi:hypothetical protein